MINWAESMDKVRQNLCERTGKPFKKTGELVGGHGIEVIDFDIIEVEENNEVLTIETNDFVTATWHPQPVSLFGRIKRTLGIVPVVVERIEPEDNMAIYHIF